MLGLRIFHPSWKYRIVAMEAAAPDHAQGVWFVEPVRHANPQVTLTVYAGMAEGAALAAGDKLAAALN